MDDEKPESPAMPWPRPGDVVFRPDDDWWMNACLDFRRADWNLYATAYKDGADALVERTITARHQLDILVYPIAFLYRHYLELRLKQLISAGTELVQGKLPEKWPSGHNIDWLWGFCRKLLEEIFPEGEQADLDATEDCIRQFSAVDAGSMAFRYPEDKEGKPYLDKLTKVNVRNLAEVIERIARLLDSSSDVTSVYQDQQRDMESDYY